MTALQHQTQLMQKLVNQRNFVEQLTHRVTSVKNGNAVETKCMVTVDGNKRGAFYMSFTKEQVEERLLCALEKAQVELGLLEKEYNNLNK